MTRPIVGQTFQIGDRVFKKNNPALSLKAKNSKAFKDQIYGHIIKVCHESNSAGRFHYYYEIKHENTGKISKHLGHRLSASPLPPR
tara:strand:- start:42 stop:299 length:258 start_codon:yes stop_codon:yes gene_type:complete